MRLAPGEVVAGKYRVESLLGRGGMGEVYVAINERLGKRIALKVMSREVLDAEEAQRFAREAKASSKIAHPGVVQVFDADVDAGRPWIAMELLRGESLAQRMSRGPVPAAEASAIMLEALDVVAAVHDAGVIHRDLKPDNLFLQELVGGGRRVKVLDFGIAKVSAPGLDSITQTGSMMGTPLYLSPEQAAGAKHVDARADLYSLGVILYAMLSAQLPYEVDSFGELVARMMTAGPRKIGSVAPHVDPALAELVDWSIAVDPAHRPQSARAFAEALRAVTMGGTVPGVGVAPEPVEQRPPRPPVWMYAAGGVAAAVIVLGAVVVAQQLWGSPGEIAPPGVPVAPVPATVPLALASSADASPPVATGLDQAPDAGSAVTDEGPDRSPSARRAATGPSGSESALPDRATVIAAEPSRSARPSRSSSSSGLLPATSVNVSLMANRAYRQSLRCFEMRSHRDRDGAAAVQFTVELDGSVSPIEPNRVSFDDSGRVHRCLSDIVRSWRFTPPGRVQRTSHVFNFSLRDIAASTAAPGELPERPAVPEVRAAAQSVQQQILGCATGSGAATVNLIISPEGRVTELTFGLDERDADNQRCIERLVRTVRFPEARAPYRFRHRYSRGR